MGTFEDKYIQFGDWKVLYCVIGNGPNVLLYNMETLSHSIAQFEPQLKYYDLEQFTIVLWDPPGYGKSRPPEKKYTYDFYYENAEYAFQLMKSLNFKTYSVWGSCSGGTTSMILAAKHPEVVRALVLSNTKSHCLPNDFELLKKRFVDTKKYLQETKKMYYRIKMYGKDNLIQQFAQLVDVIESLMKEKNGNVCSHLLGDIKCPTLIVAGAKDDIIDPSHAAYLNEHIRGSKLHVGSEFGHDPHYKLPEEFSKIVQEFLLQHNKN